MDTTGSSPLPVDEHNGPLGLHGQWEDNLDAQCWLWKDHTSYREAARITETAAKHRPHYIAKCGNTYSSEWWWSKIWHCLTIPPEVFDAAFSWVELADYIPSVLAGVNDPRAMKRGICAAGHKAFYSDEWVGLPDKEYLSLLDPKLAELRDRLYDKAYDARTAAGMLCSEWAQKLRLPEGIPVAGGAHHTGYSYCVTAEHMDDLAEIANVELVVIEAKTELRAFKRDLRHNEIYYHLAPGLGNL